MARTLALDLDDIDVETLQFGDPAGGLGLEHLDRGMAMTEFGASLPGNVYPFVGTVPPGFCCSCCC